MCLWKHQTSKNSAQSLQDLPVTARAMLFMFIEIHGRSKWHDSIQFLDVLCLKIDWVRIWSWKPLTCVELFPLPKKKNHSWGVFAGLYLGAILNQWTWSRGRMSSQEEHQCRQQKSKILGPESQDEACIPLSSKKRFPRVSASAQNTSGFWCWFVKMHCEAVRNI